MILVVDHYDSFTYNLVQLIESLGHDTQVVKSDAEPAEALAARGPRRRDPVPGTGSSRGGGVLHRLLEVLAPEVPVLGVCLGHQAIGSSTAARSTAPSPCTARPRRSSTRAGASWKGCTTRSKPAATIRSWSSATTCRTSLELTAWTEDGLVMATQHRELPRFGVQFHPESILTPEGPTIVQHLPGAHDVTSSGQPHRARVEPHASREAS